MRPACPNVIILNRYVSGALEESRAEEIAEHLAVCDRCQQRSDEMASETDGLIGAVRRGAVVSKRNDEPQLARLITEALHVGAPLNPGDAEFVPPGDSQLKSRPKPRDLESFIDGLRKSGLIDEKELHRLVVTSAAEDADSFAQELIERDTLTAYQARALSRGRWKGLVLGNYVIVEKLGKGGMGQVYKARHDRMGRTVCLKVLRSSGRRSPEVVERFRREIKTVSALHHPNFVVAHDADEAEGIQFLVMELIDGRDLSRRVRDDGAPPVNEALQILRQTASALEYAHEQGVTHRDVKPHNLLVVESGDDVGQVKVLDMGLARFEPLLDGPTDSTTRASMTASGVIMGTVDYMSPEQALNSRHADARSDIYSLGCTMYFLLTGTTMYAGDTLMEKLIAHREQELPNLRERVPDVSPGLDAVFRKMVARHPDDRYQTMQLLGEDLDACIAGRRPAALAAPWADIVDRFKARPALFTVPAAAILLIALAIRAMLTQPATADETAASRTPSPDDQATSNFIGAVGGIPALMADNDRQTKHRRGDGLNNKSVWQNSPPRRVMIVLADKGFDRGELNTTTHYLQKYGFESVITSNRKGKLHPRYNKSGKNDPVYVDRTLTEMQTQDFFSVVVMTGDATRHFAGNSPAGKQLQGQLRQTLAMQGSIVGVGPAQSIVTDKSICGSHSFQDIGGLCVGQPRKGTGTGAVIKVAESKQIPSMVQQLNSRFEETKKNLSGR